MSSTVRDNEGLLGESLAGRAARVAIELRRTLTPIAERIAGRSLRPSRLTSQLDLDKSLASRLVRGLRSDSPFEVLHFLPSPTGLGIFLDAASGSGIAPALKDDARRAVQELQNLLDELPGGRTALDALMSESVLEVRRRGEHNAKQAVFKAMTYLLGMHCETISSAIILQPSPDGESVDGIDVSLRAGMRRLRQTAPIALFSVSVDFPKRSGPGPYIEPLRASGNATNPMDFFIRELCDPPEPPVDIVPQEEHTVFALASDAASIHRPVTLASAMVVHGAWKPWRSGSGLEEGRNYLLHYPCKLLVRDVWIRDDLYVGAEPEVRLELPSPTGPARARTSRVSARLNQLDIAAPVEQLGSGLARAAARGVRGHERLLAHAFDAAGWDPSRFRGYRTMLQYPVPMITMSWWIPLTERPTPIP